MAGSVNKVILIGFLGADPEIKSFPNGGKICNLRLATTESWKDKSSGERKERTEWHTVVIGNEGLAGVAEKYLRKGSQIFVEGKLRTRKWSDKNGNDRYSTEVSVQGPGCGFTMLGDSKSKSSSSKQSSSDQRDSAPTSQHQAYGGGQHDDDFDDDIPF